MRDEHDEHDQDDGAAHRSRRVRRTLVWSVGFAIALYAVGLAFVGVRDGAEALAEAALLPLAGAVALEAVMMLSWPMVHRESARAVGQEVRYRDALNISLSAWTISHTVPGGGAVGGAEAVRRLTKVGLPGPAATASVTLTGGLSLATVALIGAGGVAVGVVAADLPGAAGWAATGAVILLVGFVVAFLALLRSRQAADRLLDLLERASDRLRERAEDWRGSVHEVTGQPPTTLQVLRILGWCTVKWGADLAALAVVFVALGQPIRPTVLVVAFGVSQLAAAIPITPGGLGFVEGGMVGTLVTFGIPFSLATTAVVLYRIISTWLPTVVGVPALLRPPSRDPVAD